MLTQVAEEVFRIAGRDPMIEVAIALQVRMLGTLFRLAVSCKRWSCTFILPLTIRVGHTACFMYHNATGLSMTKEAPSA
jgi:hypothetical protein